MNQERAKIFWELSKPRLTGMALVMTALGFVLGLEKLGEPFSDAWLRGLGTLVGTALLGMASAALNQVIEKDLDAKMPRTLGRPLPSGRIEVLPVQRFGFACGLAGTFVLLIFVNAITAVLGALTVFFYLGIYTPAKRVSSLSTIVGAIPGAIPPVLGWTAGYGRLSLEGLFLFGILFLWQIPHFLSIAWIYRKDYALGEFPVLSVCDEDGAQTARQSFLYGLALVALSAMPTLWGMMGEWYLWGAVAVGGAFLASIAVLMFHRTVAQARRVFFLSLFYLPAIAVLMVLDNNL